MARGQPGDPLPSGTIAAVALDRNDEAIVATWVDNAMNAFARAITGKPCCAGSVLRAVSIVVFAAVVCSALARPVSAAVDEFQEKVLYSFCSQHKCADGKYPSTLIDVNGLLYGTTASGGHSGCRPYGCGTVFSLNPATGTEKVLYSFCSRRKCADGETPSGGLIESNGTLYGTTFLGGHSFYGRGYGTAFALDPGTGAENVLYSFCSQYNCTDGSSPTSLLDVQGTLYGTTETGGTGFDGSSDYGTAFALDLKTGAERVLYSFCSQRNCPDGQNPDPALIEVNGLLYGVTIAGGASSCGNGSGCGTAFSLSPTGTETVIHSFGNGDDGKGPEASLVAVNGLLYGTTYGGGITGCTAFGCGTVFSIEPNTGVERVLYSFCSRKNCMDGANPFASLTVMSGTLFGTTYAGGSSGCGGGGCGTVFSIDPSTGAESVLYRFLGGSDGANPEFGLLDVNGRLYGETNAGGGTGCGGAGCGTVFVLTTKH